LKTDNPTITAVAINNVDHVSVTCSFIGTDIAGTANKYFRTGINLNHSQNISIGDGTVGNGNVINGDLGIVYQSSDHTVVKGNIIGLNAAGSAVLNPNQSYGIWIQQYSTDIQIGGGNAQDRNVVSGYTKNTDSNAGVGIISWEGNDTRIQGNYIGTDITGLIAIGNSRAGVSFETSGPTINQNTNILIGGSNLGEGNIFAGNVGTGLGINNFTSSINSVSNVQVLGNFFGTDKTGNTALGAGGDILQSINSLDVVIGGTGINEKNVFVLGYCRYINV
jgi:titin